MLIVTRASIFGMATTQRPVTLGSSWIIGEQWKTLPPISFLSHTFQCACGNEGAWILSFLIFLVSLFLPIASTQWYFVLHFWHSVIWTNEIGSHKFHLYCLSSSSSSMHFQLNRRLKCHYHHDKCRKHFGPSPPAMPVIIGWRNFNFDFQGKLHHCSFKFEKSFIICQWIKTSWN